MVPDLQFNEHLLSCYKPFVMSIMQLASCTMHCKCSCMHCEWQNSKFDSSLSIRMVKASLQNFSRPMETVWQLGFSSNATLSDCCSPVYNQFHLITVTYSRAQSIGPGDNPLMETLYEQASIVSNVGLCNFLLVQPNLCKTVSHTAMGAIWWGTRGTCPPTFLDGGT